MNTFTQTRRGTLARLLFSLLLVGNWGAATAADPPPVQAAPALPALPAELAPLLPAATDERGFIGLLGEKAPEGWKQCGPGFFSLEAGVATSHGGMGLWWHTNRMFTNFVLRGEWRLGSKDSDSGVFVRFPDPGQDPWAAVKQGHELELGDDPEGKDTTWKTGALYPFQAPIQVPTRPVGEWNSYEFIAWRQTYVIRINGCTVTVWTDPERRTTHGYLGLQNYPDGKGAQHRNLRIKELP